MGHSTAEKALATEPEEVGPALLELPEDQWLERKSGRIAPRELANALIGFANADGGLVVVGVHNGTVEGTDSNIRRRNEQTQAGLDFCVPPILARRRFVPCINHGGEPDKLLVFEVQADEAVHANKRDEVFLRVG